MRHPCRGPTGGNERSNVQTFIPKPRRTPSGQALSKLASVRVVIERALAKVAADEPDASTTSTSTRRPDDGDWSTSVVARTMP